MSTAGVVGLQSNKVDLTGTIVSRMLNQLLTRSTFLLSFSSPTHMSRSSRHSVQSEHEYQTQRGARRRTLGLIPFIRVTSREEPKEGHWARSANSH